MATAPDARIRKDGKPRGSGPQTWICQSCGDPWTRPSVRGQVPKWCPECRGKYTQRACRRCGEIKPVGIGSWNCSECWEAIKPRPRCRAVVLHQGPRRRLSREFIHVRTARRLTSGRCRVCDTWFVSLHLDVTCSDECKATRDREQRNIHRDRRRARKRDAYRADVNRRKVFEGDGYRCHLCRRKCNPTKAVPHPKAPTIDHIIPLAQGGTHEPSNCRTACFLCNATKGDRGGGEQLLLIAV